MHTTHRFWFLVEVFSSEIGDHHAGGDASLRRRVRARRGRRLLLGFVSIWMIPSSNIFWVSLLCLVIGMMKLNRPGYGRIYEPMDCSLKKQYLKQR